MTNSLQDEQFNRLSLYLQLVGTYNSTEELTPSATLSISEAKEPFPPTPMYLSEIGLITLL